MGNFLAAPFHLISSICLYIAAILNNTTYQVLEGCVLVVDEETGQVTLIFDGDDENE